jgi:hypothetical protein
MNMAGGGASECWNGFDFRKVTVLVPYPEEPVPRMTYLVAQRVQRLIRASVSKHGHHVEVA